MNIRSCFTLFCIFFIPLKIHAGYADRGEVTFPGQIVAAACSLHTDDIWQEIDFGILPLSAIRDGNSIQEKPVNLRLMNCFLDTDHNTHNVDVMFEGESDKKNPQLFKVTGSARGVALKLTDAGGNMASPGRITNWLVENPYEQRLNYNLSVVRNGNTFAVGDWSGVIRFVMQYQ
ncbi:fimbrial protein [Entomohabitans teleogrylli]|uniref:fimbrial protein n=1 Tax=Entomohabitans teleogrylli TaxID=1384589 RepID=UPI00073D7F91|nr:fimbrial protein [Entomohabitans teleogrylli]